jgi:hypothetical protein
MKNVLDGLPNSLSRESWVSTASTCHLASHLRPHAARGMDWVAPRKHEILDAKLAFSIVLRVSYLSSSNALNPKDMPNVELLRYPLLILVLNLYWIDKQPTSHVWEGLGSLWV